MPRRFPTNPQDHLSKRELLKEQDQRRRARQTEMRHPIKGRDAQPYADARWEKHPLIRGWRMILKDVGVNPNFKILNDEKILTRMEWINGYLWGALAGLSIPVSQLGKHTDTQHLLMETLISTTMGALSGPAVIAVVKDIMKKVCPQIKNWRNQRYSKKQLKDFRLAFERSFKDVAAGYTEKLKRSLPQYEKMQIVIQQAAEKQNWHSLCEQFLKDIKNDPPQTSAPTQDIGKIAATYMKPAKHAPWHTLNWGQPSAPATNKPRRSQ